jgi:hypothetical protein
MLKLRAFIVFALVLAGLQVRNASAISVYNNFGPGDTYSLTGSWFVAGPTSIVGANVEVAMSFVPSEDCTFVAADLAVSLDMGTNSLHVTLAADNSGAPGATIETFLFNDAMGPSGIANPPLQADSVTNPILDAGDTYWLVASTTGDTLALWGDSLSSSGANGGVQNYAGTWYSYPDNPTAAFSITGAEFTPVPEPASIALFGAGMLAAIGFHIVRKRQSAKRSG